MARRGINHPSLEVHSKGGGISTLAEPRLGRYPPLPSHQTWPGGNNLGRAKHQRGPIIVRQLSLLQGLSCPGDVAWQLSVCSPPQDMTGNSHPRPRELHSRRESILHTWLMANAALASAIKRFGHLRVAKNKALSARAISSHLLARLRRWRKLMRSRTIIAPSQATHSTATSSPRSIRDGTD